MMPVTDIVVLILIIIAAVFAVLGVIGLFRFPDFYTRTHAAGLVGGFGFLFAVIAAIVYTAANVAQNSGYTGFILHLIFAAVLVIITATTSTHAIARAAHKSGQKPALAKCDALKEEKP